MGRSSEITNDVKEKIISYHKSGKGYRAISKLTGVHKSTVRAIVHKWKTLGTVVNLPRSGRPAKISPSAERKLITKVTKNPGITTKELQAYLASTNVNVHGATIRKTLRVLGFERVVETDILCVKEEAESCDSESETDKGAETCDAEEKNEKVCVKEENESCDSESETEQQCTNES